MQHFLKRPPASARARIVPAELLDQFLVAVDDAETAFHADFGRETLSDACSSARKQFSSLRSFIWCMVNLLPAKPARRHSAVKWKTEQAARMNDRQAGLKAAAAGSDHPGAQRYELFSCSSHKHHASFQLLDDTLDAT